MANHNSAPTHENESGKFESIGYSDGGRAFGFRQSGDRLGLGSESNFTYTKYVGSADAAGHPYDVVIIHTDDGNKYAVGGGLVLDRKRQSYISAKVNQELTIGEPFEISGVLETTPVESVLVYDPKTRSDSPSITIDGPSPFRDVIDRITNINEKRIESGGG